MFELITFIIILSAGYFFGHYNEKRHYASIKKREEKYKDILVLSDRDLKNIKNPIESGEIFVEATAVSLDAFKKFIAVFLNFIGGRITSYESLLDRARREAVLKVKEKAFIQECKIIVNLRVETSTILGKTQNNPGGVEAIAYATGIKVFKNK